jgi:hypothetical protein
VRACVCVCVVCVCVCVCARARVFVKDKLEHKHHHQQKLQQHRKLASVDTHLEQHGAHIKSGSVIALDRV